MIKSIKFKVNLDTISCLNIIMKTFSVNSGSNPCRVMALDRDSKRVKILNKRTALLALGFTTSSEEMEQLSARPRGSNPKLATAQPL